MLKLALILSSGRMYVRDVTYVVLNLSRDWLTLNKASIPSTGGKRRKGRLVTQGRITAEIIVT